MPITYAQPSHGARPPHYSKQARVLLIANTGKKKTPELVKELLELKDIKLTVATGRNIMLRQEILAAGKQADGRLEVVGWGSRLPDMLRHHHLVIARPEETLLQEAIAARCPMIAYDPETPEEQDAADYLRERGCGVIANSSETLLKCLTTALGDRHSLLKHWQCSMRQVNHPDAAFQLAEILISKWPANPLELPSPRTSFSAFRSRSHRPTSSKQVLLCDLHTHTTFSDGEFAPRDLIDFYGQRGFDAMCITDHICDYKKLIGKMCNYTGLVLPYEKVSEYFETIEREKERAWTKYQMLLMTGLEFNKDGVTPKTSTHLLGVDLTAPIDPSLPLKDLIHAIHQQGALAIAAHPHKSKSVWSRNTLYLWENQKEFAPLIDAWEIGNRDDLYNPVGLKRLPFIANSDFHKPKHLYSWKTTLFCEKDPEAIKQCIRVNRDIAITLYRDHHFAEETKTPFTVAESAPALREVAHPLVNSSHA